MSFVAGSCPRTQQHRLAAWLFLFICCSFYLQLLFSSHTNGPSSLTALPPNLCHYAPLIMLQFPIISLHLRTSLLLPLLLLVEWSAHPRPHERGKTGHMSGDVRGAWTELYLQQQQQQQQLQQHSSSSNNNNNYCNCNSSSNNSNQQAAQQYPESKVQNAGTSSTTAGHWNRVRRRN